MKNVLFTILAFGSLIASGIASPAGPAGNEEADLVARESNDYSAHHEQISGLLLEVTEQANNLNKSLDSASLSLLEEDKKKLAEDLHEYVRNITAALNKARTTKFDNHKRDSLDGRTVSLCDQNCIHALVRQLVYEIAYTVNYIVSKLGIEAVFEYLTPMVLALVQLLAYWDVAIVGLVISVREVVNGIFVSIGITILAIVVN